MKKTDGLEDVVKGYIDDMLAYKQVDTDTVSLEDIKHLASKIVYRIHTYISERLKEVENKKLCGKGYSSCMSCPYYAECDYRQIHNSCLKSVREALGVDK